MGGIENWNRGTRRLGGSSNCRWTIGASTHGAGTSEPQPVRSSTHRVVLPITIPRPQDPHDRAGNHVGRVVAVVHGAGDGDEGGARDGREEEPGLVRVALAVVYAHLWGGGVVSKDWTRHRDTGNRHGESTRGMDRSTRWGSTGRHGEGSTGRQVDRSTGPHVHTSTRRDCHGTYDRP